MKKRIAIITGASSGMGKSAALDLAKQGYAIILIARSKEKLQKIAITIKKKGHTCEIYPADISDSIQINQVMDNIITKYKRIDVLLNGAGVLHLGSDNLTTKQIDEVVDINLKGAIYVTNKVIPLMKKQKSGYIINISSIAGVEGIPGVGLYSASKFGLCGYTESLFYELMRYGIRVTAICPSYVNTAMPQGFSRDEKKLMIPTSEILRAINYLLQSDKRAAINKIVINCRESLCGGLK